MHVNSIRYFKYGRKANLLLDAKSSVNSRNLDLSPKLCDGSGTRINDISIRHWCPGLGSGRRLDMPTATAHDEVGERTASRVLYMCLEG